MPRHRFTMEHFAAVRHRWQIVRLIRTAGASLVLPPVIASVVAGLLPVVFVVAGPGSSASPQKPLPPGSTRLPGATCRSASCS